MVLRPGSWVRIRNSAVPAVLERAIASTLIRRLLAIAVSRIFSA